MKRKFYGKVNLYIVCNNPRVARAFADRNGFSLTEYKIICRYEDTDGICDGFYIFIDRYFPSGVWEKLIEIERHYDIQKIVVNYDFRFPRTTIEESIKKYFNWIRDLVMYLRQIGRYNRYSKLFSKVK